MKTGNFFENPLMRTKITSANVKTREMLLGYLIGPFCAFISNAVFGSYLNRYYSDVIGWTDTGRFGRFSAFLPMVSVIFVIIGNLVVGRLIDNTRTPQGKARPYLFLSAPLVVIAIALLFLSPQGASPAMQMVWIALSYNLYYAVAYPFFYTAHSSMVALSTRNLNHRGMLATFSNASGVAAVGIGASILVPMLLQSFLFVEKDGVIDTAASYSNPVYRHISGNHAGVLFYAGADHGGKPEAGYPGGEASHDEAAEGVCKEPVLVDHYPVFPAVSVWRTRKKWLHELLLPLDV